MKNPFSATKILHSNIALTVRDIIIVFQETVAKDSSALPLKIRAKNKSLGLEINSK